MCTVLQMSTVKINALMLHGKHAEFVPQACKISIDMLNPHHFNVQDLSGLLFFHEYILSGPKDY